MSEIRQRRVADLVRELISELIAREVQDARIRGICITEVRVSPDYRHATLYYSLLAASDEERIATQTALDKAAGFMRRAIARDLRIRTTPQLRFVFDHSLAYAAHIEEVLSELSGEDPKPTTAREAPDEEE